MGLVNKNNSSIVQILPFWMFAHSIQVRHRFQQVFIFSSCIKLFIHVIKAKSFTTSLLFAQMYNSAWIWVDINRNICLTFRNPVYRQIIRGKHCRCKEALLSLSSWCIVIIVWLFLAVPWICLQFVIVIFSDHTHLLFYLLLSKVYVRSNVFRFTMRHHKLDPRSQPFPSRWPQGTNKQTCTRHKKHKTGKHKWSTKEVPPWNGQYKYFTGRLKPVLRCANRTLNSDVDQDT